MLVVFLVFLCWHHPRVLFFLIHFPNLIHTGHRFTGYILNKSFHPMTCFPLKPTQTDQSPTFRLKCIHLYATGMCSERDFFSLSRSLKSQLCCCEACADRLDYSPGVLLIPRVLVQS